MTKHTGARDIKCADCGKGFSGKDNLKQHRRGVHRKGRDGERGRGMTGFRGLFCGGVEDRGL